MQPPQPDGSAPNTASHNSLSPGKHPGGLRAADGTAWEGPHSPVQWMGDCRLSAARLPMPEQLQEHVTGKVDKRARTLSQSTGLPAPLQIYFPSLPFQPSRRFLALAITLNFHASLAHHLRQQTLHFAGPAITQQQLQLDSDTELRSKCFKNT